MVPRIHRQRVFQLGAVLFLSLLLDPNAFQLQRTIRSPFSSSRKNRIVGRFGSRLSEDSIPTTMAPTLKDDFEKALQPSGSNLPWLSLLAVFLCAQIIHPSLDSASAVAYSTVSATLLRNEYTPGWKRPLQHGLIFSLVASQALPHALNMLRWIRVSASGFTGWYMSCLMAFPLITKALTTAVIGWMGDTGAQILEERIRSHEEGTPFSFRQRYDRRRGLANAADGLLVTGPLLHFAYNFLETIIPVHGATTGLGASVAALIQVLIDDFVLDAIFVGIMFVTTGLGEGYKLRQILHQFRKDYSGAVRASWATSILLMPCEFVLFRCFPLHFRVLGMNLIDIVWEGIVSYMVHKRRRSGVMDEVEPINIPATPALQLN